jgi:urease accessory protein
MQSKRSLVQLLHLLQLSDSALPVGGFSFSNALESAVQYGVVSDADTLFRYTTSAMQLASTTDCVAARAAYRATLAGDFASIVEADRALCERKLCAEQRVMSQRMGRKLAELAVLLADKPILNRWLAAIGSGEVVGSYAVGQGICFALCGISEREMFVSILYSVASVTLNASLRLTRISHLVTQRILYDLSSRIDGLYVQSEELTLDDMYAFAPQIDLLVSLHEKGRSRMFMN